LNQDFKTEFGYFNTGLAIREQYDLLSALKRNGINPGNNVSSDAFKKALYTSAGLKSVMLQCYKGALTEVRTCLSQDGGYEPVECPEVVWKQDSCAKNFYFPESQDTIEWF